MKQKKLLYETIFSTLKDEIIQEVFPYDSILPSERELCLRFGVERTTIRKALDLLVQESLVQKKAGIGTRVTWNNMISTTPLQQNTENLIGFFMADSTQVPRKISQPYYADLLYNLELECLANNCQLIYTTITPNTNIGELLQTQRFLSIVFVSHVDEHYITQALSTGTPVLFVNEYYPGATSISYDNSDGAYQVLKYLFDMGHKDITLLSGPEYFYSSKEKMAGCYKAMGEYDIWLKQENILYGNWEFQSGYDCIMKLFTNSSYKKKPSAIFCFNDMMCIGAIKALKELSLSVPDDISIVGFDNMEQLRYTEPNLTTVNANVETMAKTIIDYAVNPHLINTPFKILTPVDLIIRNTVTAPLKKKPTISPHIIPTDL